MAKKEANNRLELNVTFEGKEWKEAVDKAFETKVKDVTIDGFRKGKCPRDVYEKKFGKESLLIEAAESLIQAAYVKAMEENKDIVPVVQPSVNLKDLTDEKVEYVFSIITAPEVKVKKYKGLKVKKEAVKVTKDEIKEEIDNLLEKYTELATKDGKIAEGDLAVIDFKGLKDGVAFDGGTAENYNLEIGSHTFIPGFEEGLVGLKAGDEKDLDITFPEDYMSEELKGQKVVFQVKVNEVKTKEKRKLDKDFFEDLGMEGIDSKESLEKEIEGTIKARKEMEAENKYIDALLEEIGKNVEVDIPEEMIHEEVHNLMHKFEEQLQMQGLSLDLYLQFTQSDSKALHDQLEPEAKKNVLYRLMMEEIVKLEKVDVSDKEVDAELKEMAKKYQTKEDEIIKMLGGKEMIKYDLEMRKTIDILKEANK